jgi:hypothetical protein
MIKPNKETEMKNITITVDKDKYRIFTEKKASVGIEAKDELIRTLGRYTEIERKAMKPRLEVVGKTKPKKTDAKASANVIRIGTPDKVPEETEINLEIEDTLYEQLEWEAKREGVTIKELVNEWVTHRIEISQPRMTETARRLREYIGLPFMETVK